MGSQARPSSARQAGTRGWQKAEAQGGNYAGGILLFWPELGNCSHLRGCPGWATRDQHSRTVTIHHLPSLVPSSPPQAGGERGAVTNPWVTCGVVELWRGLEPP